MKKPVKKKINNNSLKNLPQQKKTFGDRAADKLTEVAGSWAFIFGIIILIAIWVWLNITAYIGQWDPWPFILLNLFLSCLAALQAPVILMSQNRSNQRDRKRSEYDYQIDRKSQRQIEKIQKDINYIKNKLSKKK